MSATDELIEQLTVRLGTCPIDQFDVVLAALIEARRQQALPTVTTRDIAEQLGLSTKRVLQIAKRLGVVPFINKFRAAEFTAEQAALIINRPKLRGGRPKKEKSDAKQSDGNRIDEQS